MQFVTLDVFTDTPFAGNPLAVVIVEDKDRAALDKTNHRQLIAREFNLSETVFFYLRPGETLASPDRLCSEREISIFTTDREIPFAGHPTIGTAYFVLRHLGWAFVTTLVPPAGPIRIAAVGPASDVTASIPHNTHLHTRTLRSFYDAGDEHILAQIEPALHHQDAVVRTAELDAPIFSIVKGMSFLLVELPRLEHLGHVAVSPANLRSCDFFLDAGPWGDGFVSRYYYVPMEQEGGTDEGAATTTTTTTASTKAFRTRMVELGAEDPATGAAASALASYLSLYREPAAGEVRYHITQGVEMGRKSEIEVTTVTASDDKGARYIKEVRLSGTARVVMKGTL